MWSLLIITSIIFQSAVAIFLLNGVRTGDDIDKHLRAMLIILLVHLSSKFLLLAVLKNLFLYTHLPTGFSLAYGPLLLVISRSVLGRPMRPRHILFHFIPFLVFSLVYVFLVIAGAIGAVTRSEIIGYVAWYQWLDLVSLYGYPIYAMFLLRGSQTRKTQLVRQIATILLLGVSAGWLVYILEHRVHPISEFDLRLIPYICLSAIPILILRYRLQVSAGIAPVIYLSAASAGPAMPEVPTPGRPAKPEAPAPGSPETAAAAVIAAPVATEIAAPVASSLVAIVTQISAAAAVIASPAAAEEMAAPEAPASGTAPASDRRYEKSGLDSIRMDEYETALAAFMRKSKIYLDADLSLDGLASRMKMSKHHLTQLLNERVMKNFYSFVNEYRIGEAIDRLNNPALQVNILSLAFDCGFNSRSSFNSYFKKITGHTPSAYKKIPLEDRPGRGSDAAGGRMANTGHHAQAKRKANGADKPAASQTTNARGGSRRLIRDTSPSA